MEADNNNNVVFKVLDFRKDKLNLKLKYDTILFLMFPNIVYY